MNVASILNAIEEVASSMVKAPLPDRVHHYGTIRVLIQDLWERMESDDLGGYTAEKLVDVKRHAQVIAGLDDGDGQPGLHHAALLSTALDALQSEDCFNVR